MLVVETRTCVRQDETTGHLVGELTVEWRPAKGSPEIVGSAGGKRFDGFVVEVALRRKDTAMISQRCSLIAGSNTTVRGKATCSVGVDENVDGPWTADATLRWDLDGDGAGWLPSVRLPGSPTLWPAGELD